jgi:hypothetical protein
MASGFKLCSLDWQCTVQNSIVMAAIFPTIIAMHFLSSIPALFVMTYSLAKAAETASRTPLPIVNLGYVKQQASWYEPSANLFVFKNIRYAQPPLGELRFRAPEPPAPEEGVQNGTVYGSPICPQPMSPFSGVANDSIITEDCLVSRVRKCRNSEQCLTSSTVSRCLCAEGFWKW